MEDKVVQLSGGVNSTAVNTEVLRDTFPGLFWCYIVVWGLIVLYIIYLGRKCSKIEKSNN